MEEALSNTEEVVLLSFALFARPLFGDKLLHLALAALPAAIKVSCLTYCRKAREAREKSI